MEIVNQIIKNANRKAQAVIGLKERFIVDTIKKRIHFHEPRIILLKGLRGVGKTTVLLQLFNSMNNSIYFSADHPIIKEFGLFEVCKRLIEKGGYKILLIDEVHKPLHWWEDLKVISDEYPKVKMILSGSSSIALHILERRAITLTLSPMSISEYLYLSTGKMITAKNEWKDWRHSAKFVAINNIESEYWKYLKFGGFPTVFKMKEYDFYETVYSSMLKSIREDSVTYLTLSHKKINAMEKLVNIVALSKPGEFSYTSIANKTGIGKSTVYEIVDVLIKLDLMIFLRPYSTSTAMLRAEPKLLFSHPNLRYAVCNKMGIEPNLGAVREEYAVYNFKRLGYNLFTIKGMVKSPDYIVKKGKEFILIEIGGKSKTNKQLKEIRKIKIKEKIVLKDENLATLGFVRTIY